MGSYSEPVDTSLDTTSLDLSTRYFQLTDDGTEINLRTSDVLTAWLLTLVRTRDERVATFEWRVPRDGDDAHQKKHERGDRRRFSSRDALGALDLNSDANNITVAAVSEAVELYIGSGMPNKEHKRKFAQVDGDSLVLSTGTLAQTDKDDLDEVSQKTNPMPTKITVGND